MEAHHFINSILSILVDNDCCQVEIDDYRDYEKAIGALKESLKYLAKAESRQASDMAEMTERRVGLIELFVRARKSLQVREIGWGRHLDLIIQFACLYQTFRVTYIKRCNSTKTTIASPRCSSSF